MIRNCIVCREDFSIVKWGSKLRKVTKNSKYCSSKCHNKLRTETKLRIIKICDTCGIKYNGTIRRKGARCAPCSAKSINHLGNCGKSGADNARWRGGHRQWKIGRFGTDKNGLSWRKQRQRALERDNYKCQNSKCNHQWLNRIPDVHHKIPYRISFSHDLDNLTCLCKSCHSQAERESVEIWGGVIPTKIKSLALVPCCSICQKAYKKLPPTWVCFNCKLQAERIKVIGLRSEGKTLKQIGQIMNVSHQAISKRLSLARDRAIERR